MVWPAKRQLSTAAINTERVSLAEGLFYTCGNLPLTFHDGSFCGRFGKFWRLLASPGPLWFIFVAGGNSGPRRGAFPRGRARRPARASDSSCRTRRSGAKFEPLAALNATL